MSTPEAFLFPREAGRFIAETSKDVKISLDGIKRVADIMFKAFKTDQIKTWEDNELYPHTNDKAAIDWIFVADTLNFSFWAHDSPRRFKLYYKKKLYEGYQAMCAAINRAIDEGYPLTNPQYYATLQKADAFHIFRSEPPSELPLMDQRLEVLHEAGKILIEKYNGSFVNCIKACNKNAQRLLQLIVTEFSSYRDVAVYSGIKVAIYKRAQILIADICACCHNQGYGEFDDISTLTAFADYRIPQILCYYGAFEYSENLKQVLSSRTLQNGERFELEIRGSTIWAVELIKEETKKLLNENEETRGIHVNSIFIDHYLWDHRAQLAKETEIVPYHKVRCTYY